MSQAEGQHTEHQEEPENNIGIGLLLELLAVIFIFVGAALVLVIAPQKQSEYQHLLAMPELSYGQFVDISSGTDVLLTGTLHSASDDDRWIAYRREVWHVYRDSEEGWQGEWRRTTKKADGLYLTLDGETIHLVDTDPSLQGQLHIDLREGSGRKADGHHSGATRQSGLHDGDTATVWGDAGSEHDLAPRIIYGGTRDDLLNERAGNAWFMHSLGMILMACCTLVLASRIIFRFWRARRDSAFYI